MRTTDVASFLTKENREERGGGIKTV